MEIDFDYALTVMVTMMEKERKKRKMETFAIYICM